VIHWLGPPSAYFDLVSLLGLPDKPIDRIGDDIRAIWNS
jgi:hypothetical protein